MRANLRPKLGIAVIIVGVFAAIITAICSFNFELARSRSEHTYQTASDTYTQSDNLDNADNTRSWHQAIDVDAAGLQSINPDVVGWLYFEQGDISYPLLYAAGDNSRYLTHDYTGNRSVAGAIFIDGDNHGDLSDARTLIYGHNMYDHQTMFSKLPNYSDTDYANDNQFFQIITADAKYRYQFEHYQVVSESDPIFTLSSADLQNTEPHTVILSTCHHDGYRTLVFARQIDSYKIP